jgi:hypothetical protein
MGSNVIQLLISNVLATLGVAAVILHAFRGRDREKFLLWFSLFSILCAVVLVVRNAFFR